MFDQIFCYCEAKNYDKFGEEQIDKLLVNSKQKLSVQEKDRKRNSIMRESKFNDNISLPRLNLASFSGNV